MNHDKPENIELDRAEAECEFMNRLYIEARTTYEQTELDADFTAMFEKGQKLMEAREHHERLEKAKNAKRSAQGKSSSYADPNELALSSVMYGVPNFFPPVAVSAQLFARTLVISIAVVVVFAICVSIGW
jgi:hypothetical protein